MNKKIILATSCCGKSTAVKNCKLNCVDFDSAPRGLETFFKQAWC